MFYHNFSPSQERHFGHFYSGQERNIKKLITTSMVVCIPKRTARKQTVPARMIFRIASSSTVSSVNLRILMCLKTGSVFYFPYLLPYIFLIMTGTIASLIEKPAQFICGFSKMGKKKKEEKEVSVKYVKIIINIFY